MSIFSKNIRWARLARASWTGQSKGFPVGAGILECGSPLPLCISAAEVCFRRGPPHTSGFRTKSARGLAQSKTWRLSPIILLLALVTTLRAETQFEQACARLAARKGDDAERLHELFKLDWEQTMRENPEFAT